MFALERRDEILALVRRQKRVLVPELAELFGISEATARRDLELLERSGSIRRTHGGAVSVDGLTSEIPIDVRSAEHAPEKDVIGRLAARLVEPNDTIMLDASTTTLAMVEHLRGLPKLRAITSGMRTAERLGELLRDDVYVCGGQMHVATSSVTGFQAEDFVRSFYADKLFISARAISAREGVMDFSEADAHLKQVMLTRSARVVLLADSSKFAAHAFSVVARLNEIDTLVTDARPDAELASALEAAGVEVILPQ